MKKICEYCKTTFDARTAKQRFCSNRCASKVRNLAKDMRINFPPYPLLPESAYVLGLLLTDGNVMNTPHQSYVRILMKEIDGDVIEFVRNTICSNAKIAIKHGFCNVKIGSKILVNNLQQYGIVPAKSSITKYPPGIPDNLNNFFILGLMDGDGSWTNGFTKDGYARGIASFYGTKELCEDVMNVSHKMLAETIFNGPYRDKRKSFLHRICIGSIRRRNKFAHWLYDGHIFGMIRKRKIATFYF